MKEEKSSKRLQNIACLIAFVKYSHSCVLVLCFVVQIILLRLQLKELNHDNIKPFVGACLDPGHICYLMHYCSRGTVQVSL